jgi:hypothetical protein
MLSNLLPSHGSPRGRLAGTYILRTETGAGARGVGGSAPTATASLTMTGSAVTVAAVGGSTTATATNRLASTATPSKAASKLRFVVPAEGVMAAVLGVVMWL